MTVTGTPRFPGALRKNDALLMYGATRPKPYVISYEQMTTEVVHGPSCICEKEIFVDRCRAEGVPICERRGGGGTVVLAKGMVVTVVVGERHENKNALDCFRLVHQSMIRILREKAGVRDVVQCGISDCAVGNRKLAGSSLYLGSRPSYFYYQSSLLVAPDLSLFERYLRYPPREPDYRRKRPHSRFCTSLKNEGYDVLPGKIAEVLVRYLPDYMGAV